MDATFISLKIKIIKMRYYINEFVFDTTSLVLTQQGRDLDIRLNDAKVLAFLIREKDKVVSKEAMLAEVWQGKVVSEQAVFQSISNLRSLFGNQAIKTFSKRGYQWQLAAEAIEEHDKVEQPISVANLEAADNKEVSKQFGWNGYAIAVLFTVFMLGAFFFTTKFQLPNVSAEQSQHAEVEAIRIAYLPIQSDKASTEQPLDIVLDDNEFIDFTVLEHLSRDEFVTSAELEYPKLQKEFPFILTGQLRQYQEVTYFDFLLKGPFGHWQGQFYSHSQREVLAQFYRHISQPFIYDLLEKPQSPEFKQASLLIAHQQKPQDLIILLQLVESYIRINDLDTAMVMADKLAVNAKKAEDHLNMGQALLLQSTILTNKELIELSEEKLNGALQHFEQINDVTRQADVWKAQSWLDHQHKDYAAIRESLLNSAKLAESVSDYARELDALTYLSVLAYKHHQSHDKYLYLQRAEQKMKAYGLPQYHFAKVPFHYAIFAKHPADKEPHLKQVLAYTELTPEHWVAQSSRKQLMEYYIAENRLNEAQALIRTLKNGNAQNSYLKTLYAQANGQQEEFVEHAQRTFEQAQLSGQQWLTLDAALLLCSREADSSNYDFYSQFIDEKATARWRKANEVKLLALNL